MKNILNYISCFACLILLSASVNAQENVLHDREFWKANPSIEEITTKINEGHSATELTAHNFDATGYAILENAPLETIKFLLEQGNDVNKLTHDARTYIFWAAYKDNLKLMKYLVEKGAKSDIIDQHGYSLLMFAAATGQENQAIYDYIIGLGADIKTEQDRQGRNALLAYAGSMKTGELINYFIDQGLAITSVDEDGNGIFNHAAKTGNKEFMERLISEYDVSTKKNPATNENAILFASRRFSRSGEENSLEFYQYLEGLGLDPKVVSSNGNTVLQNLAYRSNSKELFEYFISKGADVNQVDEEGNNALINASSRRDKEIISLLIEHTDDINHTNKEGVSSFMRALKYNKLEVAKFIESKGAKTDLKDSKGYDLGYHLVDAFRNIKSFQEKMSYLASIGYDPKSIQKDGSTLIHAAVNKESIELLKELVAIGVDINIKDESGQTALHYAAMQADDEEVLKYLVEAGADIKATTEFDESAYDLALANELLSANNSDINFLRGGE